MSPDVVNLLYGHFDLLYKFTLFNKSTTNSQRIEIIKGVAGQGKGFRGSDLLNRTTVKYDILTNPMRKY